MPTRKLIIFSLCILIWSGGLVLSSGYLFSKKIGYVRNGMLLSKAKYMEKASNQLEREMQVVQSNLDTLKNRYEVLKAMEEKVQPSEKMVWSYKLGVAEKNYRKYIENSKADIAEQRKKLTGEALDRINEVIKSYAEENDYDYILGTTNEGNLLFATKTDDLTEGILKRVNAEYGKEKQTD